VNLPSAPSTHFLQTAAWANLKRTHGWRVVDSPYGYIHLRPYPFPLGSVAYTPRGPWVNWSSPDEVSRALSDLRRIAKQHGAIALMIEPFALDDAALVAQLRAAGFEPSPPSALTLQPPRTVIVDISPDESAILSSMKQKTRYNINLARKRGVTVRIASSEEDVTRYHAMMQITAARDGFSIHPASYYRDMLREFGASAVLLLGEHAEHGLLAGAIINSQEQLGTYVYGASSSEHRELMAPYLVQWESVRWARARGCTTYDLWGIPDEDETTLEAQFENRHDGLWGVYRFKRGWGGQVVRYVGAWLNVISPVRWQALQMARRARGIGRH
jgi:lipid II:glycine glycyltransferase (peptidoglycan interpeptide bridge formation enzyme)